MKKEFFILKGIRSVMLLVMMLTAIVNKVAGQNPACELLGGHQITASGTACTKDAAKIAMKTSAGMIAIGTCSQKQCNDPVHPCALKKVTALGVVECSAVVDSACQPAGVRWVCTRSYKIECKCIPIPQPPSERTDMDMEEGLLPASQLELFPNPATQQVTFNVAGLEGKVQLQVVNILGQQIIKESFTLEGEESYTFDIESLPDGMYKVLVRNDGRVNVGSFIKD